MDSGAPHLNTSCSGAAASRPVTCGEESPMAGTAVEPSVWLCSLPVELNPEVDFYSYIFVCFYYAGVISMKLKKKFTYYQREQNIQLISLLPIPHPSFIPWKESSSTV